MPNSAMTTVTTADSKYSRQTDFGGPLGFVSGGGVRSWPLRPNNREMEKGFGSALVSEVVVEAGPLEGLFVICKIILDTLTATVKFTSQNGSRALGARQRKFSTSQLLLGCSHEC
jgi:hypothetical protein